MREHFDPPLMRRLPIQAKRRGPAKEAADIISNIAGEPLILFLHCRERKRELEGVRGRHSHPPGQIDSLAEIGDLS
jgi:hypothetical protein